MPLRDTNKDYFRSILKNNEKVMKLKSIKDRFVNMVRCCSMVVVLGMQTLLQGSWKVSEIERIQDRKYIALSVTT